jgi:putative Mg2+ transporter-C (MgtC) family protein
MKLFTRERFFEKGQCEGGAMIPWDLLARILTASALGAVIGYERDVHGRPAGLRTHLLVALASSTFMVISTRFVYLQHYGKDDLINVDASRIAASIVTGMGFLAGGAIMRTGITVQGLTTAAALWLVGAIGMASGAGMYVIAIFVTFVGVVALTLLRRFEDKDDRITRRRIFLILGAEGSVGEVSAKLTGIGATVSAVEYDRHVIDKTLAVTLDVRFPQSLRIDRVIEIIESQRDVRRVKLEQSF